MADKAFASKLRKARGFHDFTQGEVARELYINQNNLSRYETSVTEPDIETLTRLAKFYGVTVDWLIGHGDYPGRLCESSWDGLETFTHDFPKKLKTARQKKGLSQDKVARILGIPQSNIAKYETGKLEPSITTLAKLTMFYDVKADWLLGLEDETASLYAG